MNILDPPKAYVDYRCATHGLSGAELISVQAKFYKHSEERQNICQFFNWLIRARDDGILPIEKIETRSWDERKHGEVVEAMIYDIEYWIENGRIKFRKIYTGPQGLFIPKSMPAHREPGEED